LEKLNIGNDITAKVEEVSVTFNGVVPSMPKTFQVLDCPDVPHCRLGLVRSFMSQEEVAEVTDVANKPGVEEVKDRHDDLSYCHKAYRLERQLQNSKPKLFNRLIDTSWGCDAKLWKNIGQGFELFPEIEFIEYDVTRMKGKPGKIDAHCDNESKVSMVVLLTDPAEFDGGINYFEDGTEKGRRVELKKGDAIFFCGDECEHWITPVTSGRRTILQMELSAGHETWDTLMMWYFCSMVPMALAASTIYAMWVHYYFWALIPFFLVTSGLFFGSRKKLPPGIRCSTTKQIVIVLAMACWYVFLAAIPSIADYREMMLLPPPNY